MSCSSNNHLSTETQTYAHITRKEYEARAFRGVATAVLCSVMLLAAICLPVGKVLLREFDHDPSKDFDDLGEVCRVLRVSLSGEVTDEKNGECTFVYTYEFLAPWPDPSQLMPYEDNEQHPEEGERRNPCETAQPPPPSVVPNTTVQCWAPGNGKDKHSLPRVYACYDDACVKVLDPKEEVEFYAFVVQLACILVPIGTFVLPLTGGLLLCGFCRTRMKSLTSKIRPACQQDRLDL